MKYKNLLDIVVLAAGKGSRMKSKSLPKSLHSLNGIPMINYLNKKNFTLAVPQILFSVRLDRKQDIY